MNRYAQPLAACALYLGAMCAGASVPDNWFIVRRENLCVTEGAVGQDAGDRLIVDAAKMRAYLNAWSAQAIDFHFTYLGSSAQQSSLGSGASRRQFGVKLRAQDSCNLVYAMWRIAPESKLVVSVKRNPTAHTSAVCANRGYQNVRPAHPAAALPHLRPGDSHAFRAEMTGQELRLFVDSTEVWQGDLGSETLRLEGPIGVRSDNVRLTFDLTAGQYVGTHPNYLSACKAGAEASN